jgi:hypothetical protein
MKNNFVRLVLICNGAIDILVAIVLIFPAFGIAIPGYPEYTKELVFLAGGWGITALIFGIGRIWSSFVPSIFRIMVSLGFIEGSILTIYCLINIVFMELKLLQVILPLVIGSIFGILYLVALQMIRHQNVQNPVNK